MCIKRSMLFVLLLITGALNAQVFNKSGFIVDETTGEEFKLTTQESYDKTEKNVLKACNYWLGLEVCPFEYGTLYMLPFIGKWVKGNKKYVFAGEKEVYDILKTSKDSHGQFMYLASLVKVAIENNLTDKTALNKKSTAFFIDYVLNKKNKVKLKGHQKKAFIEMKERLY